MAEIVLVARARCQKGDTRIGAGGAAGERDLHVAEKWRQPLSNGRGENLASDMRVDHPVGEHQADARRCFCVTVDDTPMAIGAPREVSGAKLQMTVRGRYATAGPQERRVRVDQTGRDQARAEQVLRAIDVGQNRIQQSRPLRQRAFEPLPFLDADQQRHQIDAPRLHGL